MAVATRQPMPMSQLQRQGGPSGLVDVLDVLLDKGLVIDAYVRVALVGIELLTIDARIVVASVDTYLRFAEAVNRLDLTQPKNSPETLPDLFGDMQESGAGKRTKGMLEGAKDALFGEADDDEDDEDSTGDGRSQSRSRSSGGSRSRSRSGSSSRSGGRSRSSSGSIRMTSAPPC